MQQSEQRTEQTIELPAWETPELVKADVSASTQIGAAGRGDGAGLS